MNQIIIDVSMNENKVAMIEENELVELYIERADNKRVTGNIYKGRVVNVLPGMQSAFIDIGLEKNAFLHVKEALPKEMIANKKLNIKDVSIRDVVKSGQEIIVQVLKEPFGTKGARVTTHISVPGRHVVVMPYTNYIGVSRRITDEKDRERLRKLAKKYKPKDMGVILRTVSEEIQEDDFKNDIEFLLKVLNKIDGEKKLGRAPRLIYKDLDLIHRTVRDLFTRNIDKLIINDKESYNSILDLVELVSPELKSRVEYFDDVHDIFGYFRIDTMINNAVDKKVWLKSGGYLVIDETEALTSIDINTGKYVGGVNLEDTVLKTNIEAAKEIAKQLRLRNIGGIIIIDFIDMPNKKHEQEVIRELEEALKKDRTKATVFGMTQLGLVEMTRKKERSRLTEKLLTKCPYCEGTGTVLSEEYILSKIENEVKRSKYHTNAEDIIFKVNTSIVDYIKNQVSDYVQSIKEEYDIDIHFILDNSIHHNDIKVYRLGSKEFIKKTLEDENI